MSLKEQIRRVITEGEEVSRKSERLKRRGKILQIVGAAGTALFLVLEALGILAEWGLISVFVTLAVFLFGKMTSLEGTILNQSEERAKMLSSVLEENKKQTGILKNIRDSLGS